ncbi:hypothetical protein TEA_001029 [Camellia sinensis var. sinensis]|uniref:Uncharacterized protein n=1 Tax=Camellia sinensis var. sinensis TaxID=542762 RepID=A0A4V3WNG7_CAMSN|nr:hypothetical protein TEA_001029 [Camellia sinensis var. sinensis]
MEGTHETEIGMRENMLYEASNPLHIAAMQGHLDFAKALVTLKKDLVSDLDSKGRSPLHLASANGYIEIVKVLLMANPSVRLVRDEDGRTPPHLAAMKGRVDVLSIRFRTVEDTWVNDKLDNGIIDLHIATNLKQVETIKYLLEETVVEVNAVNGNDITALDIIEHMPIRDLKAMEISRLLMQAGGHIGHQLRAKRKRRLRPSPSPSSATSKHRSTSTLTLIFNPHLRLRLRNRDQLRPSFTLVFDFDLDPEIRPSSSTSTQISTSTLGFDFDTKIRSPSSSTRLRSTASETMKYLLEETMVEVNVVNGNDIIEHIPIRDLKAMEISKLLMQAGDHIGHQLRNHGRGHGDIL